MRYKIVLKFSIQFFNDDLFRVEKLRIMGCERFAIQLDFSTMFYAYQGFPPCDLHIYAVCLR